jgi:8-amino-7-oxononanoate synthase
VTSSDFRATYRAFYAPSGPFPHLEIGDEGAPTMDEASADLTRSVRTTLDMRWRRSLDELAAQHRERRLLSPAGIDFSSNDYLGYAAKPFADDSSFSTSGAASRLLRGQHPIWDEVETRLASWHGAEATLAFTSGYAANEGVLSTLIEPGDWVASDALNHASIIDGLRLSKAERFIFRHQDLNHLEEGLKRAKGQRFIVVESLYGMDGDLAPLTEMAALADRYGAALIVDEAHTTGCWGEAGGGVVDALQLRDRVLCTIHTGGKALGVPGAYVVGSGRMREYLINRCRHFVFTTALPPRVGRWWLQMVTRVGHDLLSRDRLHANARRFREALAARGVNVPRESYIVPIILGPDERAVAAAASLQSLGFDVRAIRPPTVPDGAARLRISIHADHCPETLDLLAEAIASIVRAA